jgi:hypothetical protein
MNYNYELELSDIIKLNNDNIQAQKIIKNDIIQAKLKNISYHDFKLSYRPSGNDKSLRDLWDDINIYEMNGWLIILE